MRPHKTPPQLNYTKSIKALVSKFDKWIITLQETHKLASQENLLHFPLQKTPIFPSKVN